MAGVPCVNDTDCITASTDINGRLELDINTNAVGGLECVAGSGLSVKILGDPTPASGVADCNNLLGITTNGDLYARYPEYEAQTFSGTLTAWNSSSTVTSNNFTIVNPDSCAKLIIMSITWQCNYGVTNGSAGAFNTNNVYQADGTMILQEGGSTINSLSWETAGYSLAAGQNKTFNVTFTAIRALPAGSSRTYDLKGTRGGDNNITMNAGGEGLLASARVAVIELAAGDTFS